jgi:hypothetical protein
MWWDAFMRVLWDEMYDAAMPVPLPEEYFTTWMMENDPENEFVDFRPTGHVETLSDLSLMALDSAMAEFQRWSEDHPGDNPWGMYKDTMVRHLADQGGSLAPFSRYHIMVGGEASVINSTKPNHGPSQRFIVDLTDPPRAW